MRTKLPSLDKSKLNMSISSILQFFKSYLGNMLDI